MQFRGAEREPGRALAPGLFHCQAAAVFQQNLEPRREAPLADHGRTAEGTDYAVVVEAALDRVEEGGIVSRN